MLIFHPLVGGSWHQPLFMYMVCLLSDFLQHWVCSTIKNLLWRFCKQKKLLLADVIFVMFLSSIKLFLSWVMVASLVVINNTIHTFHGTYLTLHTNAIRFISYIKFSSISFKLSSISFKFSSISFKLCIIFILLM